ncbi:hypothetical protein JHK82_018104 [Glycine max]|nr:hypothetical protein JHK82_018104 [Glycine max]
MEPCILSADRKFDSGYPKSDLVKFPQYFGYSLEERIKPRFAIMKNSGVKLLPNQVLSLSSSNLDEALKKKMQNDDLVCEKPGATMMHEYFSSESLRPK